MRYLAVKAALSGIIIARQASARWSCRCHWSRSLASRGCGMIPAMPNVSQRTYSRSSGTSFRCFLWFRQCCGTESGFRQRLQRAARLPSRFILWQSGPWGNSASRF